MNRSWKVATMIGVIIVIGLLISSFFIYQSYKRVINDSTRNIAELTTMNVYSEINNELTKPIYVSITMANDTFLANWVEGEAPGNEDEIEAYLDGIKDEYDYNSVFLVSTDSLRYYTYDGYFKTIEATNDHDVWYYEFLSKTNDYELDVDVDEVTGILTIFVNVKMYDEDNNVIAVVGVGLEMEYIQEIMEFFEDTYSLSVFLVNTDGVVQSNSETAHIEVTNLFDSYPTSTFNRIYQDRHNLVTSQVEDKYIIARYIDDINWYLVVEKETNVFTAFLLDYFLATLIMVLLVVSFTSFVLIRVINDYQSKVSVLAKTDYLTLLLNRRGFDTEFEVFYDKYEEALVFITDIDRFKGINDRFGHTYGDKILRHIASIIDKEVSKYGKLSRWGGDEFTGIMIGDRAILEKHLHHIKSLIEQDEEIIKCDSSISIGYTFTTFDTDLDTVLTKADKGLYISKQQGGNKITYMK